jgi:flagellar protein FlaJ
MPDQKSFIKKRWRPRQLQLLNTLEGWSYRLFGRVAPKFLANVFELKDMLQKAGIKIHPTTYVSLAFFVALLCTPVTIVSIILLYLFRFIPLVFLIPLPAFVMIAFIVVPMSMAGERATALERDMPFAATYVTVMATGGIPPYVSFKRLSEVELMPAMRKEAKEITKDVELFGIDPLSAMEKAGRQNPLSTFRDFVGGYASTVIIGGDVVHFLETKAQDIFRARATRVRAAAERLGMLLETFIIVMVLMSLCFYILFSVDAIYSIGGGLQSTMLMYTYIFTPMLSIVFIYLAHGMQPKTPVTDMRPYKVFAVSIIASIPILLLLTGFLGFIQTPFDRLLDMPTTVGIFLITSTAPAALVRGRISRKVFATEEGIANFLRDLTEVRKTGLAPEKCIESLSRRDYGEFSKELNRIAAKISWGVSVKKVLFDFVKRTKSWMSQIVMFLLMEAIDVGGGTIAMVESLAKFNMMTREVEKEKKASLRPYVFVPYFAAILLVATTLMTLAFTAKTVSIGGAIKVDLSSLTTLFTTSVIIHSYLIGLVAGKISEESIAAGFKHSVLLVIISIIAAKFAPLLLG